MKKNAIDLEDVLERVQDDWELLLELLDIFEQDYAVKRPALGQLVQQKNFDKTIAVLPCMLLAIAGSRFKDAGYAFPKTLIEIKGKTMIEVVVNNLKPKYDHKFIFICQLN